MEKLTRSQLVGEIMEALDSVGACQGWADERMHDPTAANELSEAFREVTQKLLTSDPPQHVHWEQLLVAAASASCDKPHANALAACKAGIAQLDESIQSGGLDAFTSDQAAAVAGALTLILAAQVKLRQAAEIAICSLANAFPDAVQAMGQLSQEIWLRRGQMSGHDGLFVWDCRRGEWRLSQDFKPYRPE